MPKGQQVFGPGGAVAGDQVILFPNGTVQTASTNGPTIDTGQLNTLRLTLNVTAASGTTPSLTVTVQTSADGSTWANVAAFAAKTTTGSERKVFTGLDRFARAITTISGTTPSFTFGVTGEGV